MFKCCSLQHNIVYVFSRTLKNERIPLLVETSFALLLMCNGGWLSLRQTTKLTHSSTLLGLPIPVKYLNSFWIIPYSVPVCLRTLKVGFCQKKRQIGILAVLTCAFHFRWDSLSAKSEPENVCLYLLLFFRTCLIFCHLF